MEGIPTSRLRSALAVDSKTRTYSRKTSDGRTVETLHCDNPQCDSQITRRFVHFASKKAMNIEGLSEATLEKFLNLGYLHSFQDIYHLEEHREDIVALDGYGEKSFDRLWEPSTPAGGPALSAIWFPWIFL